MDSFKIGLLLGLSIIISIGSQNLFIIRQGFRDELPYLSALTCFLCDCFLIILGVSGISAIIMQFPVFKSVMLFLGAVFLMTYGLMAIKRSFDKIEIYKRLDNLQKQTENSSPIKLILIAISFSLLNPQAILDTLVIIGGNANHYNGQLKYYFVIGTVTASFIWFFSLALATHLFSKKLLNTKFWRLLEILSGILMIFFALVFVFKLFCP